MAERILLIEDDARLAEMVSEYLGEAGFRVSVARQGRSGLDRLAREPFDALVLDLMLPDMDGLEVCRELRAKSDLPLLMLTARGDAADRIVGLEIGADDYLPKPFQPRELLARLRAILRRGKGAAAAKLLRFGRLEIDRDARAVRLGGEARSLTGYQFALLAALAESAGRVLSRETLMDLVKGEPLEAFDRSIDVHASLAVFALAAGLLWRAFGEDGPWSQAYEVAATLAQNALPPAGAPKTEQQAALEKLAANLRADIALFAPDRSPLAAVGAPLPAPEAGRERGGWIPRWGSPAWAVRLHDGRWLEVRRLTSRLERLQAGVESLGAGELSARVKVEGSDEVARLAESFNRAAARIEELVGAHKTLLASASHELRTPLARIRMAVELMKENADPKRKSELEQDVAELDALIDEILLASRLDAVKEREADEDVDLLALAAEECARYENAELDGEPVTVRGDPRLLRRMLRNLLENAKGHGAPPIEVRVSRAGNRAEVTVCDRGPGVSEAERERVFEPFYRHAGAKESKGAGLGLALVREIARRHGGEARCAPQSGQGSCFIVVLPQR